MSEFGQLGMWAFLAIAVIASALGTAIASVATQWRKARQSDAEAGLKSQMIQRGMSTEEIERVLSAGKRPSTEC